MRLIIHSHNINNIDKKRKFCFITRRKTMGLFTKNITQYEVNPNSSTGNNKKLMICQYAAYYAKDNQVEYKKAYIDRLCAIGIKPDDAEKLFDFEYNVCLNHDKQYLLNDNFTEMWLMDLSKPFLNDLWDKKDYIRDSHFLTIGELCKLIDEAEWHFYNSHEKEISNVVWAEIYEWRRKGHGGKFTVEEYLPMVSKTTGVSMDVLQKIVNYYGSFLNIHKWS